MDTANISRRHLLTHGSAAVAGLAFLQSPWLAQALPSRAGEVVLPWADQPPANPAPAVINNLQKWEDLLASWLTPTDKFFSVGHYNKPVIDDKTWASLQS